MADDIMDWIYDKICPWLSVAALILIASVMLFIPFACWRDLHAETFSLKKDEWVCSKEYEYTTRAKVIVTHHECINWVKK